MRYLEAINPSQYAATMVFACALALAFSLPVESNAGPCDENTASQPLAAVKVKASETAKAKLASSKVSKSEKSESKPVKSEKSGQEAKEVADINMEVLTARLKKTDAIGLFTKLAIRNDVTDLMDDVQRYRKKSMLAAKMKEVRQAFEGLLMKIIALLEEDPELSRDMYVGRESIWKSLLEVKA